MMWLLRHRAPAKRALIWILILAATTASVLVLKYIKLTLATPPEKGDGLIFYGNSNEAQPFWRPYSSSTNSFGSAVFADDVTWAQNRSFILATSPIRQEAIMVSQHNGGPGSIAVACRDSAQDAWQHQWNTNGNATSSASFDVAYEQATGDVIVLYSTAAASTNELAYRTKSGASGCGSSNWSAATNLDPVRTSDVVEWVKLAPDRRPTSSLIAAAWADRSSDLSAMIWDGSSWSNEPSAASETSLEFVAAAQDVDDFDLEYESLSGDLLMVWANSAGANGTNGVRYRTCIGGATCTWGSTTTPPTFSDAAHHLDLAADPTSDAMVFGSISAQDAGDDMQVGYWSGSGWTNTANFDAAAGGRNILAYHNVISAGWLVSGATKRGVIVYTDGTTNPDERVTAAHTTDGSSWTAITDFGGTPTLTGNRVWTEAVPDPLLQDRFMFTFSDDDMNMWAKRLFMDSGGNFTWSDTEGGATLSALEYATSSPFSFGYWRAPVLTQSSYRFYNNADSYQIGTQLTAADNTAAALATSGATFRLRLLIHVNTTDLRGYASGSSPLLKLQYASSSPGGCDTAFAGEVYVNVAAGSGNIRFNDNASLSDGDLLTVSTSPTHDSDTIIGQTYQESNNFEATTTVAVGQDGVWDFALQDFTPATWANGQTYCLRATHASAPSPSISKPTSTLDTYIVIPEIKTASPTYTQSAYRWFANADSADVGSALAASNTAATQPSAGSAFRLRMLLHDDTATGTISADSFKLQVANRGADGVCDTSFLNETYRDVPSLVDTTWTQATSSADWAARDGLGTAVFDSKMWVMGGTTSTYKNDVWSSTDGVTWTQATSSADWAARSSFGTAVFDSKMWVMGGGIFGATRKNDVWYILDSTSSVQFYDNASVNDGVVLTSNSEDPGHGTHTVRNQTYEEANIFTNSQAAIGVGEDGMWDFSLVADASDSGTPYCFRAVKSDGTLLSTYNVIPEITTAAASVSCSTNISATSFGTLSAGSVSVATTHASTTMTCGGGLGCTLTVQDEGNGASPGLATTSPAYLIPSTDATLAAGTEGYGVQATTTAAGSGSTLTIRTAYNVTSTVVGGLFRTATTLASSTAAVTGRETVAVHKAAISGVTPAGSYSDTITYSCVSN